MIVTANRLAARIPYDVMRAWLHEAGLSALLRVGTDGWVFADVLADGDDVVHRVGERVGAGRLCADLAAVQARHERRQGHESDESAVYVGTAGMTYRCPASPDGPTDPQVRELDPEELPVRLAGPLLTGLGEEQTAAGREVALVAGPGDRAVAWVDRSRIPVAATVVDASPSRPVTLVRTSVDPEVGFGEQGAHSLAQEWAAGDQVAALVLTFDWEGTHLHAYDGSVPVAHHLWAAGEFVGREFLPSYLPAATAWQVLTASYGLDWADLPALGDRQGPRPKRVLAVPDAEWPTGPPARVVRSMLAAAGLDPDALAPAVLQELVYGPGDPTDRIAPAPLPPWPHASEAEETVRAPHRGHSSGPRHQLLVETWRSWVAGEATPWPAGTLRATAFEVAIGFVFLPLTLAYSVDLVGQIVAGEAGPSSWLLLLAVLVIVPLPAALAWRRLRRLLGLHRPDADRPETE
ncbi:hypothetical protein BJY21_001129 [Kineosphaera limosa]|uniref:Uncharacterized protein n=1 Tax=Kineosphaera limosa NBRC 100340 TaxID=1184609 RepID=K6X9K8_9MICO|nr:hypothetical protein [Kineosphaera limosa]NYD99944.1 hypothetical protein [Kineosphaera limosa]GAB95519.1 hypothetical protein KILIM_022_00030 [Kineosphaera limosa NBRC 100340]